MQAAIFLSNLLCARDFKKKINEFQKTKSDLELSEILNQYNSKSYCKRLFSRPDEDYRAARAVTYMRKLNILEFKPLTQTYTFGNTTGEISSEIERLKKEAAKTGMDTKEYDKTHIPFLITLSLTLALAISAGIYTNIDHNKSSGEKIEKTTSDSSPSIKKLEEPIFLKTYYSKEGFEHIYLEGYATTDSNKIDSIVANETQIISAMHPIPFDRERTYTMEDKRFPELEKLLETNGETPSPELQAQRKQEMKQSETDNTNIWWYVLPLLF